MDVSLRGGILRPGFILGKKMVPVVWVMYIIIIVTPRIMRQKKKKKEWAKILHKYFNYSLARVK